MFQGCRAMRKWTGATFLVCAAIALAFTACDLAAAAGIGGGRIGGGDIGGRADGSNFGDGKPMKYYILQVMGASGDVSFEVVGDTEYQDKLKDYKEQYRTAAIEWQKAKREAAKHKQEFTDKKPTGPQVMRKMASTFKTAEDAKATADKYQDKWNEMLEKKRAKEEGKTKTEPKPEEKNKA